MPNNVVLIDDHTILRAGLCLLLENEKDFTVVSETGFRKIEIESVIAKKPELVIMDLPASCGNNTEHIQLVRKHYSSIKIVVLTDYCEDKIIQECLSAGANAFVHKKDAFDVLLEAMYAVLNGKTYISPPISLQHVSNIVGQPNLAWRKMTKREHEVLKLVAEGYKTKEIAVHLSVSPKTIENHRANLLSKLKFKNTPALICYAVEHGLL